MNNETIVATIVGTVERIGEKQQISPKFSKRVMEVTVPGKRPSEWDLELQYERMDLVEQLGITPGTQIQATVKLESKRWGDQRKTFVNAIVQELSASSVAQPAQAAPQMQAAAPTASNPFG